MAVTFNYGPSYPIQFAPGSTETQASAWAKYIEEIKTIYRLLNTNLTYYDSRYSDLTDKFNELKDELNQRMDILEDETNQKLDDLSDELNKKLDDSIAAMKKEYDEKMKALEESTKTKLSGLENKFVFGPSSNGPFTLIGSTSTYTTDGSTKNGYLKLYGPSDVPGKTALIGYASNEASS